LGLANEGETFQRTYNKQEGTTCEKDVEKELLSEVDK
jgi:hypothetical protein